MKKGHPFKAGDAVVDNDGFYGKVVKGDKDPPTAKHVFVEVAKNHPLAYVRHPICYAADKLRKVESKSGGP